ncbi:MAG: DUF5662 family protein [Parachlamydia sp.]|nr:DUF5662 family protein [Parachlamydia sp.]
MKCVIIFVIFCLPINILQATESVEKEAQAAFEYFLDEVELDPLLTHEEQNKKVDEFTLFAESLSPDAASLLTTLLLNETHLRIIDILQNASLSDSEIHHHLASNEKAILAVQQMNVETAREMLFFVAELKIHRALIREYGMALGCPEKQLLRHDLCKLHKGQFEGYVRYFRGGRKEKDKPGLLAAWERHQHEEHHLESYEKEGFNFDTFPVERLRNNMLEAVADILAATNQRGGTTPVDWLIKSITRKPPHHRLLPFIEEALKKAHALYLASEEDPNSLFKGLPCWNSEVEALFNHP